MVRSWIADDELRRELVRANLSHMTSPFRPVARSASGSTAARRRTWRAAPAAPAAAVGAATAGGRARREHGRLCAPRVPHSWLTGARAKGKVMLSQSLNRFDQLKEALVYQPLDTATNEPGCYVVGLGAQRGTPGRR